MPCVYRDTPTSRVLRVLLGLVEVYVSTERWSEHQGYQKKKKVMNDNKKLSNQANNLDANGGE
jgi:hypothetical protein